jgi:hypothetical protein
MQIANSGRGVHKREIVGLEKLRHLPSNWYAFTNLEGLCCQSRHDPDTQARGDSMAAALTATRCVSAAKSPMTSLQGKCERVS